MGARLEDGYSEIEPVQRLTEAQRRSILGYARHGTIDAAAIELGISSQTVKNHLTETYRRLGVRSGPQAIFMLMGGDAIVDRLPPPAVVPARTRAAARRPRIPERLRRRFTEMKGTIRDLRAEKAQLEERLRQAEGRRVLTLPQRQRRATMPQLVDGEISLRELRRAALVTDAEGERGNLQATLGEWVDFLDHYVRRPGTIGRERASSG